MTQTAYRSIFFDLDGTLLPMNLREFIQAYFESLGSFVTAAGFEGELFKAGLKNGIEAMADHDGNALNSEAYWNAFIQVVGGNVSEWYPLLNQFYAEEFGTIGKNVEPNPYASKTIELLREKEYPLVLATMPMFPQQAVEWRLKWAGVDPNHFERVTHYENSKSVKPKGEYYQENLDAAGVMGTEVLMVGNNTKEDLACLELDMDAYLITDHLLNPNEFDISTVKNGSFEEFYQWAQTLPYCANPAASIHPGPLGESLS